MKAQVQVKNRKEAKLLRAGLAHKDIRALVMVIGALEPIVEDDMKRAIIDAAVSVIDVKNQTERRKRGNLL